MSARIKGNLDFLRLFSHACKGKARRRDLINFANKEEVNSICECVENFLCGNVNNPKLMKKMRRHKNALRQLRDRKKSIKKKKHIIIQHGGFLSALLTPLITIASGLIGSALGR